MASRIEDYALIGDCETAALVALDGSIDWLCWPRFDSAACFAALLGGRENGRWRIAPKDPNAKSHRRYRDDTLILETEFETDSGAVSIIDFMPIRDSCPDIIRIVKGKRGRVEMEMELIFRFDYGLVIPWVTRLDERRLRAIAGPDMLVVDSDVALHGRGLTTIAEFSVSAGEQVCFSMTWGPSHLEPPRAADPDSALERTERFWSDWSGKCTYRGEWRDPVIRSLLTLKALTYSPTGGIVAAPTTSLPEQLGGIRNWDYRYCWLRDATLTLLSLMDGGYYAEAEAWRDWLLRAAGGSPDQAQIMYGLSGERLLHEWEVPWLAGYENSKPVRIGNAAHEQVQLDVYGEVMDALHQARVGGIAGSDNVWAMQKALTARLEQIWHEPDQGIWEMRGKPQQFTHSKVMAWVAVDRAVRSAEQFGLDGPINRWRALREHIHRDVCENAYNPKVGAFTQSYGSSLLDAGVLLIPLVGFLPANDPRVIGTVACIEKGLCTDGFVLRYDSEQTDDGLPPGEGAFLACTFWLADNYVLMGRRDDARRVFERLVSLSNDVGLLAEQYDPRAKRQIGNFPQAFSHIGLLSTAFNLGHGRAQAGPHPAEQRTVDGAEPAAGFR